MSSRGKPITAAMRIERRKEAEKRQEEYTNLPKEEKIARLIPNGSTKQRKKMLSKV